MEVIAILSFIGAFVFWLLWIGAFNDMIEHRRKVAEVRARWEKDDSEE